MTDDVPSEKFALTNQRHNPDLGIDALLRRHFAGKPVVMSRISCIFRLLGPCGRAASREMSGIYFCQF